MPGPKISFGIHLPTRLLKGGEPEPPTPKLLNRMVDKIDYPRELFRGRYIKGLSLIEQHGIDQQTMPFLNERSIGCSAEFANEVIPSPAQADIFVADNNFCHRFIDL